MTSAFQDTDAESAGTRPGPFFRNSEDWESRMASVVETMREMSLQTDPQNMVKAYGLRMQSIFPSSRRMSLSRRGLTFPEVRITRYSEWTEDINPWKQPERLPVVRGGILADLIYNNKPRVLADFEIDPNDPAAEFLEGQKCVLSLPLFDRGESLNMAIVTSTNPNQFSIADLPERVWMANLFGRATQNLVLAEQLETAYKQVDRELKVVADIQRSLLPQILPSIPGLALAAHYQTSRQAGGDYYDFFALPGGRWGMLIADVSGHGTPAAVVMAVLHCIAHMYPNEPGPPSQLLEFINHHLVSRYTPESGHFVTAFYAIYDPAKKLLTYASAGHNPPLIKRCGQQVLIELRQANGLPLGIMPDISYANVEATLSSGDRLVLYTDGITEASNAENQLWGTEGLGRVISACGLDPQQTVERVMDELKEFTTDQPPSDDRTLLVVDVE